MAVGAVTLAFVTVAFDSRVTNWLQRTLGWTFVASFINAFDREARPVGATGDGYLQFIDSDVLLPLAMEEDVVLWLERGPGDRGPPSSYLRSVPRSYWEANEPPG
jgi:hypothetical protein